MIEILNGTHETVHYSEDTHLKLYVNDECEHYPPHWHSDTEILCPLEGNYTVIVGKETCVLRPGDILFIGSGSIHDLPAAREGVRIIFQINWSPVNGIRGMETFLSKFHPCCLVTKETFPSVYGRIHTCMMEIRDLYAESPALSEAMIYSRAIEMAYLTARSISENRQSSTDLPFSRSLRHNETMLNICTYLSQHCNENISLDDAAKLAGFSKYYFERLFRDYTDMSYYQYLLTKRLSLAEQYLEDPQMPITEVAYRSGFSSSAAFAKMFRQAKGVTPTQFRKLRTN